mgnify:CR=1 FL=1
MAKIRVDDLLVEQGYFADRDAALRAVIAREVRVDDVYVSSAALKVRPDADLFVKNTKKFVSRGGHKLQGALDHIGVAEQLDDVVVGDGDAKGAQEHRGALLALTVDGDHELVALVDLKLKPGTAGRDDLGLVDLLARIHLGAVVHARGADELRDDDTLGAVDDEGAAGRHQREVAHEDVLLFDLACFAIDEADFSKERCLVGHVTFLAFIYAILGLTKFMLAEFNTHIFGVGFDGADVCESIRQTIVHELLEAFRLDCD